MVLGLGAISDLDFRNNCGGSNYCRNIAGTLGWEGLAMKYTYNHPEQDNLFAPKHVYDKRTNTTEGYEMRLSHALQWDGDILSDSIIAIANHMDEEIQKSVVAHYGLDFAELRQFIEHKRAQHQNQVKTQADLFFERYPDALTGEDGNPIACPKCLTGNTQCVISESQAIDCISCRKKYWSAPVEG